jgi:hypothetical protein
MRMLKTHDELITTRNAKDNKMGRPLRAGQKKGQQRENVRPGLSFTTPWRMRQDTETRYNRCYKYKS